MFYATSLYPDRTAPQPVSPCGARRRDGGACRAPAVKWGNGRCRMHNGNALAWGFAPRWRITHGLVVRDMVMAGWLPEGTKSASFEQAIRFLEAQDETVAQIHRCTPLEKWPFVAKSSPTEGQYHQCVYLLLREVSLGTPLSKVAPMVSISRATLYRWLKADPELAQRVAESRRFAAELRRNSGSSRRKVQMLRERFGQQETEVIIKTGRLRRFALLLDSLSLYDGRLRSDVRQSEAG